MKLDEIEIGGVFWADGRPYLCSDKGTRSVLGVEMISAAEKPEGPPFNQLEVAFADEWLERATPV
jgi:hypothetical protein